jgi:hypothetical protein
MAYLYDHQIGLIEPTLTAQTQETEIVSTHLDAHKTTIVTRDPQQAAPVTPVDALVISQEIVAAETPPGLATTTTVATMRIEESRPPWEIVDLGADQQTAPEHS